jgi:hypothetical protein
VPETVTFSRFLSLLLLRPALHAPGQVNLEDGMSRARRNNNAPCNNYTNLGTRSLLFKRVAPIAFAALVSFTANAQAHAQDATHQPAPVQAAPSTAPKPIPAGRRT